MERDQLSVETQPRPWGSLLQGTHRREVLELWLASPVARMVGPVEHARQEGNQQGKVGQAREAPVVQGGAE
jgi:hypothetical protein